MFDAKQHQIPENSRGFGNNMPLNYDFDIYSEIPRGVFKDETRSRPIGSVDGHEYWDKHKVALFRDPKTVDAFNLAPKKIRTIFLQSCFGVSPSYSSVPKGYYLQSDEDFRIHVFAELEKNLNTQLSAKELDTVLDTTPPSPKQRKYSFHNRLNRMKCKGAESKSLKAVETFNVGRFINAAYEAKGVYVPQKVAEKLSAPEPTANGLPEVRAFLRQVLPRVAFMYYIFVFGTTQISVFS